MSICACVCMSVCENMCECVYMCLFLSVCVKDFLGSEEESGGWRNGSVRKYIQA